MARITAGSTLYGGKLFVPVSSSEEFSSGNPDYPCCTARGSVVALDANTGKEIWKAWVVPEEPKPWLTQPNGVVLYKPAGGAVWNAPTVDPVRGASTSAPATPPPGRRRRRPTPSWRWTSTPASSCGTYQATEGDVFMGGCNGAEQERGVPEPDGAGHGHRQLADPGEAARRQARLLAGTKSADVFALDPDDNGKLLYRVNAAGGQIGGTRFGRGSIVWGGASDGQRVYYGMGGAGLAALEPGERRARVDVHGPAASAGGRGGGLGAAPTTIPGVVFEGAADGMLFAVSAADGKVLWSFDTAQQFETVNRLLAKGGAISVSGAVAVNGMVFVGSGYAVGSGASGGNVLLAFGLD